MLPDVRFQIAFIKGSGIPPQLVDIIQYFSRMVYRIRCLVIGRPDQMAGNAMGSLAGACNG